MEILGVYNREYHDIILAADLMGRLGANLQVASDILELSASNEVDGLVGAVRYMQQASQDLAHMSYRKSQVLSNTGLSAAAVIEHSLTGNMHLAAAATFRARAIGMEASVNRGSSLAYGHAVLHRARTELDAYVTMSKHAQPAEVRDMYARITQLNKGYMSRRKGGL